MGPKMPGSCPADLTLPALPGPPGGDKGAGGWGRGAAGALRLGRAGGAMSSAEHPRPALAGVGGAPSSSLGWGLPELQLPKAPSHG